MKYRSKKGWFTGFAITALIGLSTIAIADGRRAFVPMGTADSVGIIDLRSRQVMPSIMGTINTHGSALTPDGHYLVAGSLTAHDSEEPISRPEGVTEEVTSLWVPDVPSNQDAVPSSDVPLSQSLSAPSQISVAPGWMSPSVSSQSVLSVT